MPQISIGPFEFRAFSVYDSDYPERANWTELEFAFVTGRKDGIAVRETAIKAGFKSDHIIETFGEDNPMDSIDINGTTYYGKVIPSMDKDKPYFLSALQVGTRAVYLKQLQEARKQAKVIHLSSPPNDLPQGDLDADAQPA
jgi:hypothetical protein